ncbi:hypothetical protein BCR32DRAFT_291950 [Anaeromyces robustus]|uniref:WD40 repeat-like protein n=1 Tax=Anaeromyces robustus TaxID=1754192 RepID=A0A1Y1XCN7_9FUNG|nr:hypothetical protein BCR32DRAFT_291950 [Anaeromyces robustus]|eukprot:ORX83551.1 hypothetical protein BCR32DRAFT_291950 [Anaeromyces robustus]
MKKDNYILENSYTIPINSEVLFEYYSNIDYTLTDDQIYLITTTKKGINVSKFPLPFNNKAITKGKNLNIPVENSTRFKFITIHHEDLMENELVSSNNNNNNNNNNSNSNNNINSNTNINNDEDIINGINYLLIFGKNISLYDPKDMNLLHQCNPLFTTQQSILPLLFTSIVSYKSYIIIGSSYGHLLLGQVKNNKIEIIKTTNNLNTPIIDIDVNKNGYISVAYDDGEIHLYKLDNNTLQFLTTYTGDDPNLIITQIKIGDYIIASYSSGQIRLLSYDNNDIILRCEMDLGYSEIKAIDYWNSQNIFTVIVDDVIYIWKIQKEEKKVPGIVSTRKIKTTSDLDKYVMNINSLDKNQIEKEDDNQINTTSQFIIEKSLDYNNSNDDMDSFSLSLVIQWTYQMENKYLNGIKFLKHLNCDAFNTYDIHNYKYIAVVAYDYSEINIFSITSN